MFEQVPPARPRVALVYGDAGRVSHLRDAVADHVEIVYETAAADFDASRLAGSQATAALVNLDDCDWLDPIEARLNEAGVAVVFNDPDISRNLEGWAQARWLRHLTAKLSGSFDYDPPRPVVAASPQAIAVPATDVPLPVDLPIVDAMAITERPLSSTEIESMTANFVAVRMPTIAAANLGDVAAAEAHVSGTADPSAAAATAEAAQASPALAAEAIEPIDDASSHVASGSYDVDAAALDVDTEALSAMIDARLAESAIRSPNASPEVWRVVEGGNVSSVELAPADPEHTRVAEATGNARTPAPSAPADDSDVLDALPSLGDWQLVDPDAPVTPIASRKPDTRIEPTLSLVFAELELVPIETAAPVTHAHVEPVERWMHVSDRDKVSTDKHPAAADSNGGHA